MIVITHRKKVGALYPQGPATPLTQPGKSSASLSQAATFWQIAETELIPCEFEKNLSPDYLQDESRYLELIGTFLSRTNMYFSYNYDLTRSIQSQYLQPTSAVLIDSVFEIFYLNLRILIFC